MKTILSEFPARQQMQDYVANALVDVGFPHSMRGSWKFGDFHLSSCGKTTLSDLDLVIPELRQEQYKEYATLIKNLLSPKLSMRVSIHPSDSLLEMNLEDSFILNIGEYLAKSGVTSSSQLSVAHSYIIVKISLLLLREKTTERYLDISKRLATIESIEAADVKLGKKDFFSKSRTVRLLNLSNHPTVEFFTRTCILENDLHAAAQFVRSRIGNCISIKPWLRLYLESKISEAGL